MTRTYHIGQTVIPYEIEWVRDKKTIELSMDDSMELQVRAPMRATLSDVESTLDSKQSWLLEKLYALSEQAGLPGEREFLSGEKMPFQGRQYRLKVEESDVGDPQLTFDGNEFTLQVHRFDKPGDDVSVRRKRQAVHDWYFTQAQDDLSERVDRYASKFGASGIETQVTTLEGNWGEFTESEVRLHWRLILAPVRIQDYVVVHELAHSKHEEHSRAFWNAVGSVIPDYEDRREWLRLNGAGLYV
jgi:hypothetical protein